MEQAASQDRRTSARTRIGRTVAAVSVLLGAACGWLVTDFAEAHFFGDGLHFGSGVFAVHLHAGQAALYGDETPPPLSELKVTAPNGATVPLASWRGGWIWGSDNAEPQSIAAFTAPVDGTYHVETTRRFAELVAYQKRPSAKKAFLGCVAGFVLFLPGLLIALGLIAADRRRPAPPLPGIRMTAAGPGPRGAP